MTQDPPSLLLRKDERIIIVVEGVRERRKPVDVGMKFPLSVPSVGNPRMVAFLVHSYGVDGNSNWRETNLCHNFSGRQEKRVTLLLVY